MRIAVVTAFTPGYDQLRTPAEPGEPDVTYQAWVDTDSVPALVSPWSANRLPAISRVGKRRCLYVKTHLNDLVGDHDAIIWIDARLRLTTPASEIVERYLTTGIDLVTFKHPRNPTLRAEIDEIRREALVLNYELDSFAAVAGDEVLKQQPHSETNCIVIRNNEQTRRFGLDWWAAIEDAPARDQLTFDNALARSGITWTHFDGGDTSAADCDFLDKGKHVNRRPTRARHERHQLHQPVLWTRPRTEQTPPTSAPASVSVIVPVHNGNDHVLTCLTSILDSDFIGELIIVDNGSDNQTAALCRTFAERTDSDVTVRLDQTADALGFGMAANRGADIATGDIIVILNSDTALPATWATHATRAFDDSTTFATGYVSNQAGDLSVGREQFDRLIAAGWSTAELTRHCAEFALAWSHDLEPEIVRSVHGSAIAMRRSAFHELGGFDTAAFPRGYGEEVDLCLRAMRAGYVNRVDTSIFYHHVGNATYGTQRDELNRQGKAELRRRHPARVLDVISDDLRHTPTVRALDHDLNAYLRHIASSRTMGHRQ